MSERSRMWGAVRQARRDNLHAKFIPRIPRLSEELWCVVWEVDFIQEKCSTYYEVEKLISARATNPNNPLHHFFHGNWDLKDSCIFQVNNPKQRKRHIFFLIHGLKEILGSWATAWYVDD